MQIDFSDGSRQETVTNNTWRYYDCKAFQSDRIFGYDTQYAEDIDMRLYPFGWTCNHFDDSEWKYPDVVRDYPHKLYKQSTMPLLWNRLQPESITNSAPGRFLIDFGRECVGCTVIKAAGISGDIMEVRHAEELNSNGSARYELRANCAYREFITFSGRSEEKVEFFDYKAFRYVEIIGYPGDLSFDDIYIAERHYPVNDSAVLHTSDDILDKIWDICQRSVILGTQDSYLDCMTREKGAYLGDAFITGLSHLYLTGCHDMLKKVLTDFAASSEICPGLLAVSPGAFNQHIADYSLLFVPLLHEYYMWSADIDFIRQTLPVVDGLLAYFARYKKHSGLLEDFTGKEIMVDWPKEFRDGYDDPGLMGDQIRQKGINSLLNIFYYGTLLTAEKLYKAAGNENSACNCNANAKDLSAKIKNEFLGADGFIDSNNSNHASLHSNALALMFNLVTHNEAQRIISVLKEKRMSLQRLFFIFSS